MIAVVTGASGHVGTNLVAALRAAGVDVRCPTSDVRDRAAMRAAFSGADVVFHLAAVISIAGDRGGLVQSVNVDGVRASALAALDVGVGRFVHCSSVHAFGLMAARGHPVDESAPRALGVHLPV